MSRGAITLSPTLCPGRASRARLGFLCGELTASGEVKPAPHPGHGTTHQLTGRRPQKAGGRAGCCFEVHFQLSAKLLDAVATPSGRRTHFQQGVSRKKGPVSLTAAHTQKVWLGDMFS